MALSEGIKRGTVELLILTILQDQDMYGYQLSQELANRSKGLYTLQESSMYPTLYRLVEKGVISDRQEKVGKRRIRVYYHLENAGIIYLETLRKEYCSICRGVLYILGIENIKELEE
jgi:PadR family transcriptional regulator PadR